MIKIRKSNERGSADHGWLKAQHTFSFADYYDPSFKGFRVLRVINEDRVEPAQGFGTHGHQNMEIVTYVISGALEHKDSMGNGSVMKYGDVQYMSAGSGVTHSEFNHSKGEVVHLLQIWIFPNISGATPQYAQNHIESSAKKGRWKLIVSPDGADASIAIRQNAKIFSRIFSAHESAAYSLEEGRGAWVQIVKGNLELNGQPMSDGDGAAVESEAELKFKCTSETELLLFDLP